MRTTKQNSTKNNSVPFGLPDDTNFYDQSPAPVMEQIGWASLREIRRIGSALEDIALLLEHIKAYGCAYLPSLEEVQGLQEQKPKKPKRSKGSKKED